MIVAHIKNNQLHLNCSTAEDTAQLDNWSCRDNPIIYIREFYGMSNAEPCEYEKSEGGLALSPTGYIIRQIGKTIWNTNVLK